MNTPDDIVYHRQVKSHTGMIWECHGAPDDAAVRRETDRLVAAGGVVVTRPKSPETVEMWEELLSFFGRLSGVLLWLMFSTMLGKYFLDHIFPPAWDATWHVATIVAVSALAGSVAIVVGALIFGQMLLNTAIANIPRHMR